MRQVSVDAIGSADGRNLGKIQLLLQEDGVSWSGAQTEPNFVLYTQIQKYGTSISKNANLSTTCLYVRYKIINGGKLNRICIYLNFDSESALDSVLEILLECIDGDPHHCHESFVKLPSGIEETSIPCAACQAQDELQTSCITTSFVKTHVIFLQFFSKMVLAGVGDRLQIFEKDDSNKCWKHLISRQVFQGQHLHGLRINSNNYMVIYGGRKVSLLKLRNSGIRLIYSFRAPDWVLDCLWLEGNQVALLTANNALILYSLSLYRPVVKSVHYCVERCILYSGTILGKSWNDIVVLAGTVFSTIVIWSNSGDNRSKETIHRLEGHKGVIFSVTFCDKNLRICSTSDDRTVRVWDVAFVKPGDWTQCTINLKFTLYGHSARVWKSSILECGKIVSIGEDSRICLWHSDGTLETQYSGHQDGEVWSLDVSEELQLVASGGSDGGINLWPLKKAQLPHELKCNDERLKPKCVGLSAEGQPFMVSWNGEIFLFSASTWELCLSEPELKSYCLHAVTPDRQLLGFASITGRLIICRLVGGSLIKVIDTKVCEGRVYSLVWISTSSVLICGSAGEFSIWTLSADLEILNRNGDFILPHSKERWVTSCAADNNYVVCGDRCGSLYLYLKEGRTKNPVYVAKRIHGQNGVTDVKLMDGIFVSTGRDGTYREFLVEHNKLVELRSCKLKLDWAAAVYDSNLLGRVLFCFHEMSFIIWNIKDRQEIVKIDCGGGHRSWDCTISTKEKRIFITFIKGKSVKYCCIPVEDVLSQSLLPGNHPKAINSAAFVSLTGNSNAKMILLAGEDTTLRLVSVDEGDQIELRVLQRHLSSVRAVACHQSTFSDTMYIASGGGRGQLLIWKVHLSLHSGNTVIDVVELTSYSVIPQVKTGVSSDAAEMRIMDLQVYQPSSASVMIAACCSDGVLRIFNFSVESNCISEVQAIDCQNCLLKVCVSYIGSDPFLIATTTNGAVFFYPIGSSGLLTEDDTNQRLLVSETGINSCDSSEVNGNFIVACAGDDSLVKILLFNRDSSEKCLRMADKWVCDAAHTCQVSGLKILDNFVFTAALDQKLAIFSWAIAGNFIRSELIRRFDLCIPDIHGVLAWPHDNRESYYIFVYGIGTQLLKFSVAN